jgi:hypothetical protein
LPSGSVKIACRQTPVSKVSPSKVPGLELCTENGAVAVDARKVEHLAVEGDRLVERVRRDDDDVDARR